MTPRLMPSVAPKSSALTMSFFTADPHPRASRRACPPIALPPTLPVGTYARSRVRASRSPPQHQEDRPATNGIRTPHLRIAVGGAQGIECPQRTTGPPRRTPSKTALSDSLDGSLHPTPRQTRLTLRRVQARAARGRRPAVLAPPGRSRDHTDIEATAGTRAGPGRPGEDWAMELVIAALLLAAGMLAAALLFRGGRAPAGGGGAEALPRGRD